MGSEPGAAILPRAGKCKNRPNPPNPPSVKPFLNCSESGRPALGAGHGVAGATTDQKDFFRQIAVNYRLSPRSRLIPNSISACSTWPYQVKADEDKDAEQ
jgi:hypothetical protein